MSQDTNDDRLCGLCEKNQSKYCCPRCNILYCSLDCYKSNKHLDCSENFYKECVDEELASNLVDSESKNKMIEILNRMNDPDLPSELEEDIDSDDDDEIDLHSRIRNLNLDDADSLWDALTNDEKNEFQALLNGSNIGDIVPHWRPWWINRKEKKLVEDVKPSGDEEKMLSKCPSIITVPLFNTLTSVKPSPSIRPNIINVLAAYAFIKRYFNGEEDPLEATICVLSICDNLNNNSNFDDPDMAVEAVSQKCLQSDLIVTDKESLEIMRHDTFLLHQGPSDENPLYYTKAAISDLIRIFSGAKAKQKLPKEEKVKGDFSKKFPDHDQRHLPALDVSKVKKCIKKLEFYLSFINTCTK